MPVVDASVCVALFKEKEPGHQAAVAWMAAATLEEEPIVAPVILLSEVAAALARATRDKPSPLAVVELLRSRRLLELFPIDEKLAGRAAVIAATFRINGADAIYVALADQLEMPLISFDRQQMERGRQVVTTHTPASAGD